MFNPFRRFVLSLSALAIVASLPALADGSAASCSFCAEVCYDSGEYGIMICSEKCGEPSGPATCEMEPNPCEEDPEKPVWNHCEDFENFH